MAHLVDQNVYMASQKAFVSEEGFAVGASSFFDKGTDLKDLYKFLRLRNAVILKAS